MRVLIDGLIFNEQRVGGISRYYSRLVRHLNADTACHARVLIPFSRNEHLHEVLWNDIYGLRVPRALGLKSFCRNASRALAPLVAPLLRFDVLHETYFRAEPQLRSSAARVTTVYDMIHELLGLDDRYTAAKAASVDRSDQVICISENTRRDLIRFFRVPEEKTSVVYLACDDFGALGRSSVEETPFNNGRRFLLHVGRRGGYKNFTAAIRAFAAAGPLVGDMDLVSFGKSPFGAQERDFARECGLDPTRLVHVSGSDTKLAQLYSSATAMIFPSLHEGFGLPLIEAMSAGCPVICSRASCIPEVAGDAAFYFDPNDIDSIRHAIQTVTSDNAMRADLVRRGYRRWREFSWQRCAQETCAIYRNLSPQV